LAAKTTKEFRDIQTVPDLEELGLLIGGHVALERMIVCGVIVAGCVQLWLARRHVAVAASFSLCFRILRLYGFPSKDSDYDLRGVHILPASEAVGLLPKQDTIEFAGLRSGIDMDLVTHDVLKFFTLLLKRNCYVLETALFSADRANVFGAR